MKVICNFEPDSLTLCYWDRSRCSKPGAAGPGQVPEQQSHLQDFHAIQHRPDPAGTAFRCRLGFWFLSIMGKKAKS